MFLSVFITYFYVTNRNGIYFPHDLMVRSNYILSGELVSDVYTYDLVVFIDLKSIQELGL